MSLKAMILQKYGSMKKCAEECTISYSALREVCGDESRFFRKRASFARNLALGFGISVDELISMVQESQTLSEMKDV